MTNNDLISIKESISRIEKFPVGYPKLITDVPEKWRAFFEFQYELCMVRQEEIAGKIRQPSLLVEIVGRNPEGE